MHDVDTESSGEPWVLATVVGRLRARLADPLPGVEAQRLMAPVPRTGWRPAHLPDEARRAAALLLLYEVDGTSHLALTLRAPHLPHHGGQVSLPGGAGERDESAEATALREAAEEVGLDPASVTVLGRLTPLHIPVSGFVLQPVVACTPSRPAFAPETSEVARVLEVPLAELSHPHSVRLRLRHHEGRDYEVPYFFVEGEVVWGATAMVLSEFLAILGHPPFRPPRPAGADEAGPTSGSTASQPRS